MPIVKDLSGNGVGVMVEPKLNTIDLSVTDAPVPSKTTYLRVNGAGNITIRPAGASADIVIPAKDGEYVPIDPGSIVRKTGTTVTSLLAVY